MPRQFNPHALALLERTDPEAFAQFMAALDAEARDAEREKYEGSLLEFFKRAWREIEPGEISINWHHERICDALEDITFGVTRDLIINIPPRHSKSLLVNVMWPAWVWCRAEILPLSGPQVKFLCVSYGATLAESIALKMQRLVMGHWYQSLWGDRVQINADQKSRADFGNSRGGERISNSIEGGLLGRGGDIQIIDDPHNVQSAESDLERESTLRAISEGLPTRVTDPRISARVLIMQRLHTMDATAWCVENWRPDHVHLMYPSEFEPDRASPSDPRTEAKQLLWPEFWTADALRQAQKELSEYAKAGQFQQMPVPRGGGIIKREWWKPWPELGQDGKFPVGAVVNGRIQYPAFEYIVGSVDTAFTDDTSNDPCAMTVWGVFRAEGKGRIERRLDGTYARVADDYGYPKIMLIYGWEKHLTLHGPPEEIPPGVTQKEWMGPLFKEMRQANWGLVETVVDTCKRYKIDHLIIETQAAGLPLENELRMLHSEGDWGVEVRPAKTKKEWRAHAVSHMWSNGQVYAPTYEDNTHPSWCEPVIDQVCLYPRSKRDDLMDTATSSLAHVRQIGIFERKEEWESEETHIQEYQINKQMPLPYELG